MVIDYLPLIGSRRIDHLNRSPVLSGVIRYQPTSVGANSGRTEPMRSSTPDMPGYRFLVLPVKPPGLALVVQSKSNFLRCVSMRSKRAEYKVHLRLAHVQFLPTRRCWAGKIPIRSSEASFSSFVAHFSRRGWEFKLGSAHQWMIAFGLNPSETCLLRSWRSVTRLRRRPWTLSRRGWSRSGSNCSTPMVSGKGIRSFLIIVLLFMIADRRFDFRICLTSWWVSCSCNLR